MLFQNVFDNSDEGIIIVTNEMVEYINETFLKEYQLLFDEFDEEIK